MAVTSSRMTGNPGTGGGKRGAAPPPWPMGRAAAGVWCGRVPEVNPADHGGDIEPDDREPGHRRVKPRVDSASVPDGLDPDTPGNDDRDASASAVDMQVDDVVVELRLGEVKPYAAQVRADVRFRGALPLSG